MGKRIIIRSGSIVAEAELNETETTRRIYEALLIKLGVTQLDVGAAAKPPARAVLTPYKGCFRADYRPPLHKLNALQKTSMKS